MSESNELGRFCAALLFKSMLAKVRPPSMMPIIEFWSRNHALSQPVGASSTASKVLPARSTTPSCLVSPTTTASRLPSGENSIKASRAPADSRPSNSADDNAHQNKSPSELQDTARVPVGETRK